MASFFALPPETCNNIYELLLAGPSPNVTSLTASRLLHEEAASYFYQQTGIDISLMEAATTHATILPPMPDRYLRYSRKLIVNFRVRGLKRVHEQAQRLVAMADHCASVTTLTLNVTSTDSMVVSNTLDEYVLHASHPLTSALQHLLSRSAIHSIRVNLQRVRFAPGVSHQLASDDRLKVFTSEPSIERPMYGHGTQDHLRELDLGSQEIADAEDLQCEDYDDGLPSISTLNTALSELDYFSPTEDLGNLDHPADDEHSKPSSDEMMFDMGDLDEASEDELTEDDDVDDEEMGEIDDIEAIVDNLVQVHQQRLTCEDVCYMTNSAPNMLRVWSESLL
jgi:hypothetical protein